MTHRELAFSTTQFSKAQSLIMLSPETMMRTLLK